MATAPDPRFAPLAPSVWALAWRQMRRDTAAGQLRLLALAVLLAVAALTAVGFFADRLNAALARDARQLLGGDAIVASDQPAPPAFAAKAAELGLVATRMTTFPSMGRARDERGGAARLVSVKAVSNAYPLRGSLRLKAGATAPEQSLAAAPQPGTVWVDPALLGALGLHVGDDLLLGDAALRIAQIIVIEPDRGAGFMAFSPRVLLNEADLAATALIQPASRVTYRLAVAAPPGRDATVGEFTTWAQATIKTQAPRGLRLESFEAGRPEMRQTLDRAKSFLNLVALLAALLAAVAVGIAARDFAQAHLDDCAMLRVLGLSQARIAWAYTLEFVALGVAASLAGVAAGGLVHLGFVALLRSFMDTALPPPGWQPALYGLGVGLTLLLGFGLAPVLQLARVPPLRVLRRDLGGLKAAPLGVLALGALGFAALLLALAQDRVLGLITVGGFAAAVAVFALAAWAAVALLKRAVPEARAPRWLLLATRQLASRTVFSVIQVAALAVGLMALILLVLLRTDLVDSWRNATPADAPNRFVINIQPEQEQAFRAALANAGVARFDFFPMIRGRLVAINEQAINPQSLPDERARRSVEREFNLSHGLALPYHNQVVAGAWQPGQADALSVEEGLANSLGIKLGDRLRFDAGGHTLQGRVTSLRKVDWGSMRVNFFVMFPLASMPDAPRSYISAFRAPAGAAGAAGFDNALSREFSNLTNVDVSASVAQVQRVLDQVIRAVEFLFAFTLATGLVVLVAGVSATREARAREFALMRALGASSRLLAQVQRTELLGVGALAGVLASLAALAVGWALARWAFEFVWAPPLWVPLAGAVAGAALALAAGWFSLRQVLRTPVVETLRRSAE